MVVKYEIQDKAYCKCILHAVKHKTSAVNGVLIGRVSDDGVEGGASTLHITDAVPFFHGQLALLPMLELALLQVDEHLSLEKGGLQIVGYYHANERFDDDELNLVARKIGDHVIRFFPQAVILLLDNKRLASLLKNESLKSILQLYLRDANRIWKQAGQVGSASGELALKDSTANNLLVSYILEGRDKKVVDFDEHLDDVTKDWLNRKLFD